jgi:hypothetical protein
MLAVGNRRWQAREEVELGVRGVAVSSGGGHYGDGGARRWPEVALDGKAASANGGGGWLGASTVPCGGWWLSGRPGVAQRRTRVVRGGRRLEQRRMARVEWSGWAFCGCRGKRIERLLFPTDNATR